jgi:hypothetical protein
MTEHSDSSKGFGHKAGKLLTRGIVGLISITATATVPLLMQRYLGPILSPPTSAPAPATAPSAAPTQTSNPDSSSLNNSDLNSSNQNLNSSSQKQSSSQEMDAPKKEEKPNLGEILQKRLQEKWNKH